MPRPDFEDTVPVPHGHEREVPVPRCTFPRRDPGGLVRWLRSLATAVGAIVLAAWLAGLLGLTEFRIYIGPATAPAAPAAPTQRLET